MITTFLIRASSTITFTSKRAISARSSSHKNEWTAKWPIASCVKQWQQSVHQTSGKASFTMLSELLARAGEIAPRNQTSVRCEFSRQFDCSAQETQIVASRNFDPAELLQVWREPLGVEQGKFSRMQMFDQCH